MTTTATKSRKFHGLLNRKGMMQNKAALVGSASNGRTESSRELTDNEYDLLVLTLEKMPDSMQVKKPKLGEEADKQLAQLIRTGLYYFRQLGFLVKVGGYDYPRINDFCTTNTAAKKRLDKMTKAELVATITQVQMMYKKTLSSKK
jgi:hypothetical protein